MAYAIIIFAVLFADQLSKALIFAFNVEGLTIIPGLLALDKTMNTGMAFGMLGDKEWAIPYSSRSRPSPCQSLWYCS